MASKKKILPVEQSCDDSPDQIVIPNASSLPTSVEHNDDTLSENLPDQIVMPNASSLPTSAEHNDDTLSENLKKLDLNPETKQGTSKPLKKASKDAPVLDKQEKGNTVKTNSVSTLKESLRSEEWMTDLAPYIELNNKVTAYFEDPNIKWERGKLKTSFTYLLLDPRMTDNLPAKQGGLTKLQKWTTFVNSIFYVGKGSQFRPYTHLKDVKIMLKSGSTKSENKKEQRILDIWQNKLGVVCLFLFLNVIPDEAHTYEAAMIDVIGLSTLTNSIRGTYYGVAASWPPNEQKMLGLYLLYKAMHIFMNEREKQLRPDNI